MERGEVVGSCERCGGTGFEVAAVKDGSGKDVDIARPCACRRAPAGRDGDVLLQDLRVPARYEHCSLETFELLEGASRTLVDAYRKVSRYCTEYGERGRSKYPKDKGLGLLFTGGNGTGKTHLAVAALRELAVQHGVRGQFWDYHELLREIRNCYNPATALTEYDLLEPIIGMEVLLLDDLGAWKMTDWMNDTLFYILNQRFLAARPTLITTNYPDRDVGARDVFQADPAVAREYLVDRIGPRLRSRLLEACAVLRLEGPDRRQLACQGANLRLVSWEQA